MSNSNQNLVKFFREAAPYIHMHRGKTFVIAISGEVLLSADIRELLSDIAVLSTLGIRVVLVHGARPQISAQLLAKQHESVIHKGVRVTDSVTLELSKAAVGSIRLEIENHLNTALCHPPIVNDSLGVISGNYITAKPTGIIGGIDYLHTGKVRKIHKNLLTQVLDNKNIALISPLGYSPTGQIYNLHFEEVASFTASELGADKLIFIQEKVTPNLPKQINFKEISHFKNNANNLLFNEISHAIQKGVERAHLISINMKGELLLELYTRDGAGIMIDNGVYDEPRIATIDDISGILDLIRPIEASGTLAKRTRETLELEIKSFSVIERDGKIIGCAALHLIDRSHFAELACLAIHEDYRKGKRGVELVEHISEQAKKQNVKKLIILTTQSIDWFHERGFESASITDLPDTRQKQYDLKRNSKVMIKTI